MGRLAMSGSKAWIVSILAALATFIAVPALAAGGGGGAPHLDGAELGLIWVIPFAGILLSIAIMPLVVPDFWHHHFGKISAMWAAAFLIPFTPVSSLQNRMPGTGGHLHNCT